MVTSTRALARIGGLALLAAALAACGGATDDARAPGRIEGLPAPSRAAEVAPNLAMLRNVVEAVQQASPALRKVVLVTGAKFYGIQWGASSTPCRESDPRQLPPNFYYDQEDWLREARRSARWRWVNLIPPFVSGYAVGNPMNLVLGIGLYAAVCKELGMPLRFPGSVGAYEALHQIGPVGRELLRDHAADRQAADHRPADPQPVQQRREVGRQPRHRIGAGRGVGQAVTALVVADEAEAHGEPGAERVPDAKIRAERVDQHERRRVGAAGHLVMDHDVVEALERHAFCLPASGLPLQFRAIGPSAETGTWRGMIAMRFRDSLCPERQRTAAWKAGRQ